MIFKLVKNAGIDKKGTYNRQICSKASLLPNFLIEDLVSPAQVFRNSFNIYLV